jgi:hypothetical protein
MKNFAESLQYEMERNLDVLQRRSDLETLESIEQAIGILTEHCEKLKVFICDYDFAGPSEEMHFFKHIKPQFTGRMFFYVSLYHLEATKPCGSVKAEREYYQRALEKTLKHQKRNLVFEKYWRTGSTYLDDIYFLRRQFDIKKDADVSFTNADPQYTTSHDQLASTIVANDLLRQYLDSKLNEGATGGTTTDTSVNRHRWTGSKVALVELIYALHCEGVFDNGSADLKEIAQLFSRTFDVDLGQYHRTFLEIRERKSDRTKFLNSIIQKLVAKMDKADD